MNRAVFVISTGRCGTQWLTAALRGMCGDAAEVTHEPLHLGYAPRRMLGARHPARLDPSLAAPILAHAERIEAVLTQRAYIECGFPLWSTLPWLLRRFAGRASVVHLVRHPVPTAWSWVAQQAYCPPIAPHLQPKEPLSPFDPGARFTEYRACWPVLHPYEKALFYWAEVNAFALRLQRETDAPWLRVRFEELFTRATPQRILALAGIAPPCGAVALSDAVTDAFPFVAGQWCDPAEIARHPRVLETCARLGYDALAFDAEALRRHYCSGR